MKGIRSLGLIVGIECQEPVGHLVLEGQKNGLLFVTAGTHVIRFLPNLKVSHAEIDQAVDTLAAIIAAHSHKQKEGAK
ncbi:Acetylornithine aminotransferase [compost metagenome]